MILGSMAALTKGAAVQIWNQKPSPLVAVVFKIGDTEGECRLFQVLVDVFDACDDVVPRGPKSPFLTLIFVDPQSPFFEQLQGK